MSGFLTVYRIFVSSNRYTDEKLVLMKFLFTKRTDSHIIYEMKKKNIGNETGIKVRNSLQLLTLKRIFLKRTAIRKNRE